MTPPTDENRAVAAPSEDLEKYLPRTTNRVTFAAMATAGLMWPVLVLTPTATADPAPSTGVPCLDLVQQLAASPPSVPETLETAASALSNAAPPPSAPVAPAPAADVVAMAAPTQPTRVAASPAAPPAPAPPVPAAPLAGGVPPVPPVTVPVAPIAEAVPGVPLLPSSLPVQRDFVCEGTAWSAGPDPGGDASPQTPLAGSRRGEW